MMGVLVIESTLVVYQDEVEILLVDFIKKSDIFFVSPKTAFSLRVV